MAQPSSKDAFNYIGTACSSLCLSTHRMKNTHTHSKTHKEKCESSVLFGCRCCHCCCVWWKYLYAPATKTKTRACLCRGQKPLFRAHTTVPVRINFLDTLRILSRFWTNERKNKTRETTTMTATTTSTTYIIVCFSGSVLRDLTFLQAITLCCNSTIPFKIKGPFSQVFLHRKKKRLSVLGALGWHEPEWVSKRAQPSILRLNNGAFFDLFCLYFIIVAYSNFSWSTKIAKL